MERINNRNSERYVLKEQEHFSFPPFLAIFELLIYMEFPDMIDVPNLLVDNNTRKVNKWKRPCHGLGG
jgi:hypothetical protein